MKSLILIMTLIGVYSAMGSECSQLNGSYDVSSMSARCQVEGLEYTPGDDSPLYTILPAHTSEYINGSDGSVGIPGYVEPNTNIKIEVDSNCSNLSMTIVKKKSYSELGKTDSMQKMKFEGLKSKKKFFEIKDKQRDSGCDYGVCGSAKTVNKIQVNANKTDLTLNIISKTRGLFYYLIPFGSKTQMECRFPRI